MVTFAALVPTKCATIKNAKIVLYPSNTSPVQVVFNPFYSPHPLRDTVCHLDRNP